MQRLQESLQRRRIAENEVAFHQSVIDAAALAIAVYAEDGHCLAANDAMASLFGTTRPMMARQNFRLNDAWAESGLVNAAARCWTLARRSVVIGAYRPISAARCGSTRP